MCSLQRTPSHLSNEGRYQPTQVADEVSSPFSWKPSQVESKFSQRNNILSTVAKHNTRQKWFSTQHPSAVCYNVVQYYTRKQDNVSNGFQSQSTAQGSGAHLHTVGLELTTGTQIYVVNILLNFHINYRCSVIWTNQLDNRDVRKTEIRFGFGF